MITNEVKNQKAENIQLSYSVETKKDIVDYEPDNSTKQRLPRLEFMVTPYEKDLIKHRAKKSGQTVASYLRSFALNGYVIERNVIELQKLIWEINKIGVNINQIVHLANQNKSISQADITSIQVEHMKVWDMLDKFVEW